MTKKGNFKTVCLNGHLGLYVVHKGGKRQCKGCAKESRLRYVQKLADKYGGDKYKALENKYMFGGNREMAIQRDGEKCVKCGMTREEHRVRYNGKDITVDHIDRNGHGVGAKQKNNSLTNLQTLCLTCHLKKDNPMKEGSRRWKKSFTPKQS